MQPLRVNVEVKEEPCGGGVSPWDQKHLVLPMVEKNPDCLQNVSSRLRADPEVVSASFHNSRGETMRYADSALKQNPEFIIEHATYWTQMILKHIDKALLRNRTFVLRLVERSHYLFDYAALSLKKDEAYLLEVCRVKPLALVYMDSKLKKKKPFALQLLEISGLALGGIDAMFYTDKEVVLAAIDQYVLQIWFRISKDLQKDRDVLIKATQLGRPIHSPKLRRDPDFLIAVIQGNGAILKQVVKPLLEDRTFVLRAVITNHEALKAAPLRYKRDQDFLLEAISENARVLQSVPDSLRKKVEFLNRAVEKNPEAKRYIPPKLRSSVLGETSSPTASSSKRGAEKEGSARKRRRNPS